jgi:hypothetical protein
MNGTLALAAVLAASSPDPAALVRQLADPSFAVRHRAEVALTDLGRAAADALRAGASDADPQVRTACVRLLPLALRRDRESRLAALLTGRPEPSPDGLPWWPRFRVLAGDDLEARRVYVAMVTEAAAVLEAAEAEPLTVREQLPAWLGALGSRLRVGTSGQTPEGRGELAAALLLAGDPVFVTAASQPLAERLLGVLRWRLDGPDAAPLRRLYAAWLAAVPDRRSLVQGLTAARAAGVRECVPLALRLAADRTGYPSVRATAVLVVASLGTAADAPALERLHDDDASVYAYAQVAGRPYGIEVGDVAVAAALRLRGLDPRAFGYEVYVGEGGVPGSYVECGFRGAAERAASRAQWRAAVPR